jgi:hypothetical protein
MDRFSGNIYKLTGFAMPVQTAYYLELHEFSVVFLLLFSGILQSLIWP